MKNTSTTRVFRFISPEGMDHIIATRAFVDDLEPGDLAPHQIVAVEEFFDVDMGDLTG